MYGILSIVCVSRCGAVQAKYDYSLGTVIADILTSIADVMVTGLE